jgi:serine/threonine protein kinase
MVVATRLSVGTEPFPGFRLTQFLGRGTWGEVWKATEPSGRQIALKFLCCESTQAASQEIRALQAVRHLRHPNLIRIEQVWCHLRRVGTLDYIAPEVFQGRLSDRSDQFALAVTYCQLRGGQLPFPNSPTTFRTDYIRPAPDLSMLSHREKPIIARALDPVPMDRWPSCGEVIQRLRPRQ